MHIPVPKKVTEGGERRWRRQREKRGKIEEGGKKGRKARTRRRKIEEEKVTGRESSIKDTEEEGTVKALCPLTPQTGLGDLCISKSSA